MSLDIMSEHFKIRNDEIEQEREKGKLKVFYVDGLKFEKISRGYKIYGKAPDGKVKCLVDLIYISSGNYLDFKRYEYLGEELENKIETIAKADFFSNKYANDPRFMEQRKENIVKHKQKRKFSLRKVIVIGAIAGISLASLASHNIKKLDNKKAEIVYDDPDFVVEDEFVGMDNVIDDYGNDSGLTVDASETISVDDIEPEEMISETVEITEELGISYLDKSLGEIRSSADALGIDFQIQQAENLYKGAYAQAYRAYYTYLELKEEGIFSEAIENARKDFWDALYFYEESAMQFNTRYEFANYCNIMKDEERTLKH